MAAKRCAVMWNDDTASSNNSPSTQGRSSSARSWPAAGDESHVKRQTSNVEPRCKQLVAACCSYAAVILQWSRVALVSRVSLVVWRNAWWWQCSRSHLRPAVLNLVVVVVDLVVVLQVGMVVSTWARAGGGITPCVHKQGVCAP